MAKDTSWGSVADWYDDLVSHEDSYQAAVILPNLMRLLSVRSGERVLDLACGQGFFSRAIAATGGVVLGADISSELIAVARGEAHPGLEYRVLPAEKLDGVSDASFDAVICVLALQNIRDMNAAISEASRVLKRGGRFLLVLNHPCFRVPKRSGWGFDETAAVQYRRIDAYLSESAESIEMHPGEKGGAKTVSFHRPLQLYFKHLSKHGLSVRRLEEWNSHRKSEPGPRQAAEDRARKEIPLFLCLEAVKPK